MSALSDLLNSQPITARQAADKAVADGVDLPYGPWNTKKPPPPGEG